MVIVSAIRPAEMIGITDLTNISTLRIVRPVVFLRLWEYLVEAGLRRSNSDRVRCLLSHGNRLLLHVSSASRWALALIFLYAGIPKLISWYDFALVINSYAILPESLAIPAAFIIAGLEVVAAIALLCNRLEGLWGISALLLLFIGVLSYAIWQGLDIDCGCFGPEDPEHKAFAGIRTALFRDILLCIPVLYLFWYRRQSLINKNVEEN